jgi:predicted ATPase
MLNVQFLNFRCFTRSDPVDIRPITLLIGENSTGKSSFLAGLRFIFEAFSSSSQNIFNKEPFFLGGFEEIAHRRPRRLAAQFEMKVNIPDDNTGHHFIFTKGEPQPELSTYKFVWSDHDSVAVSLADNRRPTVTFEFRDIPDGTVTIEAERGMPSGFLRTNLSYFPMPDLNSALEKVE